MANRWTEQWNRVNRWLERFRETSTGRPHDRDSDYYQDEAYSFFQNCYHLKDWLKNDPAVTGQVNDVEAFISQSPNLSLCADICNGSKHLLLTRHRASADTRMGTRDFRVDLVAGSDDPPTISAKYVIESTSKTFDSFTVGEACVKEWAAYLKGKGLL
jgi:hypothetical protein